MPLTRILSPASERAFYPVLEAALTARDVAFYHPYDSRRSVVGWPDYSIELGRWLLFAELKKTGGRPTVAQAAWLDRLRGPWRASLLVDVGRLDDLLRIVDNMRTGRLDRLGPAGLAGVVVVGDVRARGSSVVVAGGRPADEPAEEAPATPRPRRTLGSRRRPRGS